MKIRKRNGIEQEFDLSKIENAVKKANATVSKENKLSEDDINKILQFVISNLPKEENVDIEVIQDLVEKGLMNENFFEVAKSYILYREERAKERFKKLSIVKEIKEKLEASNPKNQNANLDEKSFGGRKGEADSALLKQMALDYYMSPKAAKNHINNRIYLHDLDSFVIGDHNCTSCPIDELLANGFKTRQVFIRPAGSVNTAFQLVAVIFQLQSLQQFGGVAATHIDWSLAPYVRKSFMKHYIVAYLKDTDEFDKLDLPQMMFEDYQDESGIWRNKLEDWIDENKQIFFDKLNLKQKDFYFDNKLLDSKYRQSAIFDTIQEVKQGAEGMLHNLNSLQSRSGNQLPFSSINYGTCTQEEGRIITRAILSATIKGVGNNQTSIFPCQIFQKMKGVNDKGSKNYDLYQLAIRSTAKRMYPNYVNCDWSKDQGYNKDDPRTYPSTMGAVRGDSIVSIKINDDEHLNIKIEEAIHLIDKANETPWVFNDNKYAGYTKFKCVKDCKVKSQNQWVDILKIEYNDISSPLENYKVSIDKNGATFDLFITEDHPLFTNRGRVIAKNLKVSDCVYDSTTNEKYNIVSIVKIDDKFVTYDFTTENDKFDLNGIVSHNCRTYSSWDINAPDEAHKHMKDGRGNIAPATIILPTLAMEAKKKTKDNPSEIVDCFMKILDTAIEDCKDGLIERFNWICAQSPDSAKFMYENHTFYSYGDEFEKEGIRGALKHGTLAIGQIGMAETLQILIGTDQTTEAGMKLAKQIEQLFYDRCKEYKERYRLNFGNYYSPAENLSFTSMQKFQKKYGLIENVSAKMENGKLVPRNYFTNSIHVPVWKEVTPFEKIDIESQLTGYSSAGCITYIEIGDNAQNNLTALEQIVDYAMAKDIPYFALNVRFSDCTKCGYSGYIDYKSPCPKCGASHEYINDYARITGYLSTKIAHFNKGKQEEANDRYVHVNKLSGWKK